MSVVGRRFAQPRCGSTEWRRVRRPLEQDEWRSAGVGFPRPERDDTISGRTLITTSTVCCNGATYISVLEAGGFYRLPSRLGTALTRRLCPIADPCRSRTIFG
jgi:hypothetical protein